MSIQLKDTTKCYYLVLSFTLTIKRLWVSGNHRLIFICVDVDSLLRTLRKVTCLR